MIDSKGTTVCRCICTSCKRYYNLGFRQWRNKHFWM